MLKVDATLGQNILAAMWMYYKEAMVMFDGDNGQEYNPEDFEKWVEENLWPHASNLQYIDQLATVVIRVFQDIHKKSLTKEAYIINGKRITADLLVSKQGLVARLTSISKTWALPTVTDEHRLKMLTAVLYGKNQAAVDAARETATGGSPITLPYLKKYSGIGENQLTTYVFPDLSNSQSQLLDRIISKVGKFQFGEGLGGD